MRFFPLPLVFIITYFVLFVNTFFKIFLFFLRIILLGGESILSCVRILQAGNRCLFFSQIKNCCIWYFIGGGGVFREKYFLFFIFYFILHTSPTKSISHFETRTCYPHHIYGKIKSKVYTLLYFFLLLTFLLPFGGSSPHIKVYNA